VPALLSSLINSPGAPFERPSGTRLYIVGYPALHRRAIVDRPSGTVPQLRLEQNSAIRTHLFSPLTTDTGNRQLTHNHFELVTVFPSHQSFQSDKSLPESETRQSGLQPASLR
jgi:hypothetical protein